MRVKNGTLTKVIGCGIQLSWIAILWLWSRKLLNVTCYVRQSLYYMRSKRNSFGSTYARPCTYIYTFVTYGQTSYIITNRGEAFLAQRREDLFLVCVCFYETFQSVHQIICELFSYWISPPSQLLPRLSFLSIFARSRLEQLASKLEFSLEY